MSIRPQRLLSTAITYFQTVARLGSIRAAADSLNVAPSAVSRQIAKLEHELGAPLFERLPRGLQLTSAGEILTQHARASASEFERGRAAIQDLRGLHRGEVALATVESVAAGFLPRLLTDFWAKSPRISTNVLVSGSTQAFHAVVNGEADLVLAFDMPITPKLQVLASARLRLGAVMSPKHRFASAKSVRFRDFVGEPVFLTDPSMTMRPSIEAAMRNSAVKLTVRAVTNSVYLMNLLASANTGVAFETRLGIPVEEKKGNLVFVPLAEPQLKPQKLILCSRIDSPLSPAATVLSKALAGALAKIED